MTVVHIRFETPVHLTGLLSFIVTQGILGLPGDPGDKGDKGIEVKDERNHRELLKMALAETS